MFPLLGIDSSHSSLSYSEPIKQKNVYLQALPEQLQKSPPPTYPGAGTMIGEDYVCGIDGSDWKILVLPCGDRFMFSVREDDFAADPMTPDGRFNSPEQAKTAAIAYIDRTATRLKQERQRSRRQR